jgi:molybdate transport system ATP-binding protein
MQLDLDIRKTLRAGQRTFHLDVQFQATCPRVVLLGPSGAGKSMVLKAIAGLMRPDAGHIRLDGAALYDADAGIHLKPQIRNMAYVFQEYALFPHLNVRQNIAFGLKRGVLNAHRHQTHPEVEHWLATFQLETMAHQFPVDLSGGQRQRVALARALIAQPTALLLDEPFAALDPALRATMRSELDELQKRLQVPMVLITHDPADAEMFGEQVVRIQDGKVVSSVLTERALTISHQPAIQHSEWRESLVQAKLP